MKTQCCTVTYSRHTCGNAQISVINMVPIAGLGQGRPASPIFNLMYIDPLHLVIQQSTIFKLIIFADDIILFSILSYNYSHLIQGWLQREIDNISNCLSKQNIKLSTTKTNYKIFHNSYIEKKDPNILNPPASSLYGEKLQCENGPIKYLGFYLSYNLNKIYHLNHIIKKANYSLHLIRISLGSIYGIKVDVYFKLIKTCVLSTLSYCNIFLINANKQELKIHRILHNKILWYITGARFHTHISWLCHLAGQIDIYNQIETNFAIYWNRLLHITDNNPLYSLVRDKWHHKWKYYYNDYKLINTKYKIKTYQKRSLLWKSGQVVKKYKIIKIINLNKYKYYDLHCRLFKYVHVKLIKPNNLCIIYIHFTDDYVHKMLKQAIYIYTDGSIKNEMGGCNIYTGFN